VPGTFSIEWKSGNRTLTRLVAVNVDPEEGALEFSEPGDKEIPGVLRVTNEAELDALLVRIRFGQNLSLLLLCVAGIFILCEALLANRLAFGRSQPEKAAAHG